jgi:hypothetical protein
VALIGKIWENRLKGKIMAKRMTLDETWKNCLSMWRWIAKQIKNRKGFNGFSLVRKQAIVERLKAEWIESHGFSGIRHNCFFCEYDWHRDDRCTFCPAEKIEKGFHCHQAGFLSPVLPHSFAYRPIAFYNKLVSLNRKRLKAKK